jgi:rhodanese-related sulfurtransferase
MNLTFLVLVLALSAGCISQSSTTHQTAESPGGAAPLESSFPALDASKPYTDVDAHQAKAIIDAVDVVILDVRGRPLYDAGHIPGAMSMPEKKLTGLSSMDRGKTYLLYCGGNAQSISVGSTMSGMGFRNMYRLVDGYRAWRAAGYPREK